MRKASVGDASVRSLTQAVLRNQALLDRLQGVLEGLKTLPRDQGAASSETAPETLAESPPVPGGDEVKKESLPPLPPGTRGRVVLTADLDRLLSDGKLNPEKKELDPVTRLRAEQALTEARAKADVLESQIRVELRAGMEMMRERGAFIQYAPGAKVEGSKGIITAGESSEDGGMRLYRYYPEEFPDIYDRKREIEAACEISLRQVLSLLE
jgi:hypothetical protein